jgi:hypothetical protein
LQILGKQQQDYFQPACTVAEAGACAKLMLDEEAKELAALLVGQYDNDETVRKLQHPPPQGWLVQTSACSPKDALQDGGAGPHHSLKEVLLALMASDRVHRCIRKQDYCGDDITFFLVPFDPAVTVSREVRVFVNHNRVTSMSQYDVTSTSPMFVGLSPTVLAELAKSIVDFHETQVKPRWTVNTSYTMDVEVCQDTENNICTIRLLELNTFGAEMAAGSALFHWERDHDIMYGKTYDGNEHEGDVDKTVCFRVRE